MRENVVTTPKGRKIGIIREPSKLDPRWTAVSEFGADLFRGMAKKFDRNEDAIRWLETVAADYGVDLEPWHLDD